jgi:Ca2+-binding RTX toxin-like protein
MSNFDAAGHAQSGSISEFQAIQGDRIVMDWSNLNVDAGQFWAAVKTGNVDAVGSLVFSGDDKFDVFGAPTGAPVPVYSGYAGNDLFHLNKSLNTASVVFNGGAGDDTFKLDDNFNPATDRIDGGDGNDTIILTGGTSGLSMTSTAMVNVENLVLTSHFNYAITMNDNNVAAGQTLTVDGSAIDHASLKFDGHAESNGAFVIIGDVGNDTLVGGRGADTINGGGGADLITGGQGADHFVFTGPQAAVFGGATGPTVTDFAATGAAHDVVQLDAATFADFTALQAHMAQVGLDVVISLDATDTVTLQNVSLSSLGADDFLFV